MAQKLRFAFDKEGDVLDISIGKPKPAISRETKDDVIIHLDPKTNKIVGFTILNFTKHRVVTLPIQINEKSAG